MTTRTLSQREEAHAQAAAAWAERDSTKRPRHTFRSPVDGLAERIACERSPKLRNPRLRETLRAAAKAQRLKIYAENLRRGAEWLAFKRTATPVARYWPHQGPRECARRLRQMQAAA